jgi:hypothetical protein
VIAELVPQGVLQVPCSMGMVQMLWLLCRSSVLTSTPIGLVSLSAVRILLAEPEHTAHRQPCQLTKSQY